MKKAFILICVSFLMIPLVNGQSIDLNKTKSTRVEYDSYIKKYTTNRTIGRVLLGSGMGMIIGGGVVFASYARQGFNGPAPVTAEALFIVIGPAAALASIPFLISAKRNKTKADLVIKEEQVTFRTTIPYQSNYPALALTIHL